MTRKFTLSALLMSLTVTGLAGRTVTAINEGWTCDGEPVTLPHTWNATDDADGMPAGYHDLHHNGSSVDCAGYLHKTGHYVRQRKATSSARS